MLKVAALMMLFVGPAVAEPVSPAPPAPEQAQTTAPPAATNQSSQGSAQPSLDAIPASEQQSTSPPAQQVVVEYTVRHDRPGLMDLRPAQAMFGAVGGLVSASMAHDLAESMQLENTNNGLTRKFAEALALKNGAKVSPTALELDKDFKLPDLISSSQEPDHGRFVVVGDSGTIVVVYKPFDWGKYTVTYRSGLHVVDRLRNKVVLRATCSSSNNAGDPPPAHDDLTRDDGKLLKTLIESKTSECLNKMIDSQGDRMTNLLVQAKATAATTFH